MGAHFVTNIEKRELDLPLGHQMLVRVYVVGDFLIGKLEKNIK